jgi:hypothetical protein
MSVFDELLEYRPPFGPSTRDELGIPFLPENQAVALGESLNAVFLDTGSEALPLVQSGDPMYATALMGLPPRPAEL